MRQACASLLGPVVPSDDQPIVGTLRPDGTYLAKLYGEYQVPAGWILVGVRFRPNGGRVIETIDVKTFAEMFGALFATKLSAGTKPTLAEFVAACDAPITRQGVTTMECRGWCTAKAQWLLRAGVLAP